MIRGLPEGNPRAPMKNTRATRGQPEGPDENSLNSTRKIKTRPELPKSPPDFQIIKKHKNHFLKNVLILLLEFGCIRGGLEFQTATWGPLKNEFCAVCVVRGAFRRYLQSDFNLTDATDNFGVGQAWANLALWVIR